MTDEEVEERFVKSYPEFCCNGKPLSPFWDLWEASAEFAYNKANEWHYVKDGDLPTKKLEEKQLLVRVRNYTEDYILAYYMLDKYYSKNGKRFYSDIDCDYPIDIEDVIAWKEIVLPEPSKYWDLSTGENNINKEDE